MRYYFNEYILIMGLYTGIENGLLGRFYVFQGCNCHHIIIIVRPEYPGSGKAQQAESEWTFCHSFFSYAPEFFLEAGAVTSSRKTLVEFRQSLKGCTQNLRGQESAIKEQVENWTLLVFSSGMLPNSERNFRKLISKQKHILLQSRMDFFSGFLVLR